MNKFKFEHVVNNIVAVSLIIVSVFTFGCSPVNEDISMSAVAKDFKPVITDRLTYPYDKTQHEATLEAQALAKAEAKRRQHLAEMQAKQEAEFMPVAKANKEAELASLDCFCTFEHRRIVSRGAFQSPPSHVFSQMELNQAAQSIHTFTHQFCFLFETADFRVAPIGPPDIAFTAAGYYVIAQPVRVFKRRADGLLQSVETFMSISCEPARKQTTFVIPNTQLHPVSAYVDGHFIECDGHNNYKVTAQMS